MATKRDENCCLSCGRTWFPRGQDLSDRCPSCKSEDVTFLSLRSTTLAEREAALQSALAKREAKRQADLAADAEQRTMATVRELVEAQSRTALASSSRRANAIFSAVCIGCVLVGTIVALIVERS